MLPQTNGGTYYTPAQSNEIRKSLIDEAVQRAKNTADFLKTAPESLTEEQFNALLAEVGYRLAAELRQIKNS